MQCGRPLWRDKHEVMSAVVAFTSLGVGWQRIVQRIPKILFRFIKTHRNGDGHASVEPSQMVANPFRGAGVGARNERNPGPVSRDE